MNAGFWAISAVGYLFLGGVAIGLVIRFDNCVGKITNGERLFVTALWPLLAIIMLGTGIISAVSAVTKFVVTGKFSTSKSNEPPKPASAVDPEGN